MSALLQNFKLSVNMVRTGSQKHGFLHLFRIGWVAVVCVL